MDDRLSFAKHIAFAKEKASKAQAAVARIMPNVGGPKTCTRLLITSVVRSILLYASPVWAGALQQEGKRLLNIAYRQSALRVTCGYRTISTEAAYVLAGMYPVDLIAEETTRRHENQLATETPLNEPTVMDKRQTRWDTAEKGRWTYTLIPNINRWINRKHGELNFEMTQFLSGHGGFAAYLHKLNIIQSPDCPACPCTEETPEHVVFHCRKFENIRSEMGHHVGVRLNPENIIDAMIESSEIWDAVMTGITKIINQTRRDQLAA